MVIPVSPMYPLPSWANFHTQKSPASRQGFFYFTLFHIEYRIVHDQIIHMTEGRQRQRYILRSQTAAELVINRLIGKLRKMAVTEINILHMTAFSAYDLHSMGAEGMDIVKIQIAHGAALIMFTDEQVDRMIIDAVHGNIGERQILHMGKLFAHITAAMLLGMVGQIGADSVIGISDIKIAEGTVADHSIIGPGNTHTAGMTGQIAVGHRHLFTGNIASHRQRIGPHYNGIIPAGNVAVGHCHIA